ncbi:MAG: tyrosinase family protein [Microcystis sp. LE18-22.4A]|jgi:tyrosinase|uniref:tyrosinase family protein n=1 Tax=Microcystis sp. LE18-22.4A TaxID=3016432 RepID=UPI0022C54C0B|nr:tyrosinase family protein [Microcystis sp. LE18-22.4A]MCZ8117535.1 tyrosinase family protein [Microcystis sp. LE18-22.4A]
MTGSPPLKIRYSIGYLQDQYDCGNKKPLEDLIRAWKGIQELPITDKRSFFVIGGYHGEPFQYRKQVDELSQVDQYVYWGGYCNHGNVLFPTWHRVYVLKLEEALQSIVPDVTMPYWDETDEYSIKHGIPAILTQAQFELDGEIIDNPLKSFILPEALSDSIPSDDRAYEKPKGYETVRYPLSGLVGTPEARAATESHNAQYPHPSQNTELLNKNIVAWLTGREPREPEPEPDSPRAKGTYWEYQQCLHAPNYTVFSNTTSANQWNLDHANHVVSLESPHNDIHLAIGGFDIPSPSGLQEAGLLAGANGDMGENNTAAMDPIFFFHHCNVDRMFWLWQKQNGFTDKDTIEVIQGYAGTNSSDDQGPTPGIAPDTPLNLYTPLNPFVKDQFGNVYTSRDCINIEEDLGYTYAPGSLEKKVPLNVLESGYSHKKLMVRGINRALFQGSFVLRVYATVKDENGQFKEYYLGSHSVLSRRNVVKCANCLTHLEVIAYFPLDQIPENLIDSAKYRLDIQHRGSKLPKLQYNFAVID